MEKIFKEIPHWYVTWQDHWLAVILKVALSQDIEECFHCQNKYSKSLSWAENLKKLFTVLGGKFKFSAQDSDLEYLFLQPKNSPVSSD